MHILALPAAAKTHYSSIELFDSAQEKNKIQLAAEAGVDWEAIKKRIAS